MEIQELIEFYKNLLPLESDALFTRVAVKKLIWQEWRRLCDFSEE